MDAKSNSISFAGAATLLFAIIAIVAIVCSCTDPEYQFKFGLERPTTIWMRKPTCGDWEANLPDDYPENPGQMYSMILERLQNPSDRKNYGYALDLDKYTKTDCKAITLEQFINLYTSCGGNPKLKSYANFMSKTGAQWVQYCAYEIINELDGKKYEYFEKKLDDFNKFVKAALGLRDKLTGDKMYAKMHELVTIVDLTDAELDVDAMFKVATKHRKWDKTCNKPDHVFEIFSDVSHNFLISIRDEVNFVNVARGIGAIQELSLGKKFPLVDEYVRLAHQMIHQEISVKENLNKNYNRKSTFCFSK